MARDLSADVRRAVVTRLNAVGSRTVALAEGRAYGPAEPKDPVWPFVRVDLPVVTPAYDGCSDASEYAFRVHGFAVGEDEANASALGAAIIADLDGLEIDLPGVVPAAHLQDTVWTATQYLRDTAKERGWHAAVTVNCSVAG